MSCWYCYWGWAKPVAEIFLAAVERLYGDDSALMNGPSHIVWSDENFDWAEKCLEDFSYAEDLSIQDLEVVRWSLIELSKIPVEQRMIAPADYDGEHPENFPPTVQVIKL